MATGDSVNALDMDTEHLEGRAPQSSRRDKDKLFNHYKQSHPACEEDYQREKQLRML